MPLMPFTASLSLCFQSPSKMFKETDLQGLDLELLLRLLMCGSRQQVVKLITFLFVPAALRLQPCQLSRQPGLICRSMQLWRAGHR